MDNTNTDIEGRCKATLNDRKDILVRWPNDEGSSFKSQLVSKPPSEPPPPPETTTTCRWPTSAAGRNIRTSDDSSQPLQQKKATQREPAQVAAGHKGLRVAVANLQKLDYVTELVDELVDLPSWRKPVDGSNDVRAVAISSQQLDRKQPNKTTQQSVASRQAVQCNCSCQSAPEINQVAVDGERECTWCSDKKSHSIGGTEQPRQGIEQSLRVCCTCCCGCPVPNDELKFAWLDRAEIKRS